LTPDEDAAVGEHLYFQPVATGLQRKSSFMGLRMDARAVGERDIETGQLLAEARSGSWLAAFGYAVLLDQIGTCFTLPGRQPTQPDSLHALRCFSNIAGKPTLHALYAMRNALAHDYSLFNPHGNPLLRHAFKYTVHPAHPLVTLPTVQWTGSYVAVPDEQTTVVNLRKVGDLVEETVSRLRAEHQAQNLELRLGVAEFRRRYQLEYWVG
jgi:hypothetical protein